ESYCVELQRGIYHAGHFVGEFLQGAEVRGGDRGGSASCERLDDGAAERRALDGIGAGAEFVDQHQRLRRGVAHDLREVAEVRAERGERRLDALLVADVGEEAVEERDLRSQS